MEPASARTPAVHRYQGNRARIALGAVCGVVALIGIAGFLAEGLSGAGLVAFAVGLGAIGLYVFLLRRLRARGVRVEPGRIGRVGGDGSTTEWCDLDAAALATVHDYGVVFGGRQRNLVLWTTAGGDRGLPARFARAGMSADQRRALAAAESTAGTGLAPFVVELSELPDGADAAILEQVRHLRSS